MRIVLLRGTGVAIRGLTEIMVSKRGRKHVEMGTPQRRILAAVHTSDNSQ
jgi:hypothetical protein